MKKEIFDIFTKLESAKEAEKFLKDILTDKELEEVSKRWELIKGLYEGKSQRKVKEEVGVSIATVTRGSQMLQHGSGGFSDMLEKTQTSYSHAGVDISRMRKQIDEFDNKIIDLLGKRMNLMPYVAQFKKDNEMRLTQREREEESIEEKKKKAKKLGIDPEFIDVIFVDIFHEAKRLQTPNLISHTLKDLKKLAKKNPKATIPVFIKLKTDTETPISLYKRITKDTPYSFIFESVGEQNDFSKYSFIGTDPSKILSFKDNNCAILNKKSDRIENKKFDNPLDILREETGNKELIEKDGLPRFLGGAVGFLTYDCVSSFENRVKCNKEDTFNTPEAIYGIYDKITAYDHHENSITFIYLCDLEELNEGKYQMMVMYFNQMMSSLEGQIKMDPISTNIEKEDLKFESNIPKKDFINLVKEAKKDIVSGEVFQLVLSQRFQTQSNVKSFDLYRSLRQVNPSSYLFYLNYPDFSYIGASPETFVKIENGKIKMRALAGTMPRGKTNKEDKIFENQLLSDKKEIAEHMMLVDLARNDVGKVSKIGSCEVKELMKIVRSSYVMHIASNIEGELDPKYDALDVLKSCFPRGTLSGAPKIRAMELINKYEKVKRNLYGGAVHYLDYSGNLDAAIGIRTMMKKDNTVYIQTGCGIVHDSIPEKEYEETKHKAKGIMKAVSQAQQYQIS